MSNKSILQFPNEKQFIVTFPKGLVLAKGWKKGDKIDIKLDDKGNLILNRK